MAKKTMRKITSTASSWWKERSKILASITKPAKAKIKKVKARKVTKTKNVRKIRKSIKTKRAGKTRKATKARRTR